MPSRSSALLPLTRIVLAGILAWAVLSVWTPVRVVGGSMIPALMPGDIAIVKRHASVMRGDVALIGGPRHQAFLHRVVAISPDGTVQTQGDANMAADQAAVPDQSVNGRMVAVIPIGTWMEGWRQRVMVR